jgi:amino acid efflux transporter
VPAVSIATVAAIAFAGLVLAYLRDWGAEAFLVVPNSLVIVVYVIAMAAAMRLLSGRGRLLAAAGLVPSLVILPFAGVSLVIPAAVAAGALGYRFLRFRR